MPAQRPAQLETQPDRRTSANLPVGAAFASNHQGTHTDHPGRRTSSAGRGGDGVSHKTTHGQLGHAAGPSRAASEQLRHQAGAALEGRQTSAARTHRRHLEPGPPPPSAPQTAPSRLRSCHEKYSRGPADRPNHSPAKKKHGSLKFHGGEAWGRGVQGAFGSYSGCILPSLVVSSLSRPRSLLFASCCLLFWRVFVRSLREHAGFKEGSLRRLRSFILAIFASKDGRRS